MARRSFIRKLKSKELFRDSIVGAFFMLLISAVLSAVVTPIVTTLGEATGFSMAIEFLVAAVLLMVALDFHKGTERLPQDFVTLLLVLGFGSIISSFIPQLAMTYQLTFAGIAMLLTSAYLGLAAGKRVMKKIKL